VTSLSQYKSLILYHPTEDQTQKIIDFRNAMASSTGDTSNMYKIDSYLHDHDLAITSLQNTRGLVRVSAAYVSPSNFEANSVTEITAYANNLGVAISLNQTNTGTVVLNINGLGAKSLMKYNDSGTLVNLSPGDLKINSVYIFIYNGTVWVWVSPQSIDQTGWVSASLEGEMWTYVSSTTFTVSGDVRVKYPIGTKIKLTNSGLKYFYVIGSSYSAPNTTVTITGGTDFTLTGAGGGLIISPYYSYMETPQGFPHWFSWTPTFVGFSADPSGGTYQFLINGKLLFFNINIGTAGTSNATTYTMTLPFSPGANAWGVIGNVTDNGAATGPGRWLATAGTNVLNLYPTATSSSWTASSTKRAIFQGFVQI
jgi:hypothetical protein